jgi:membrane protein implicated in regulation of membrane protease activity
MLTPIVAAFLIGAHPAFIWIAIILGIFVIFFAIIMSNVWDGYINNSDMALAKAQMPKLSFLMDNLPVTMVVFLGLLCISMFFGWRFKAG